jgi:hypothetical protein
MDNYGNGGFNDNEVIGNDDFKGPGATSGNDDWQATQTASNDLGDGGW